MPYELVFTRHHAKSATKHETHSSWTQTTIAIYFYAGKEHKHVNEKNQSQEEEKCLDHATDNAKVGAVLGRQRR